MHAWRTVHVHVGQSCTVYCTCKQWRNDTYRQNGKALCITVQYQELAGRSKPWFSDILYLYLWRHATAQQQAVPVTVFRLTSSFLCIPQEEVFLIWITWFSDGSIDYVACNRFHTFVLIGDFLATCFYKYVFVACNLSAAFIHGTVHIHIHECDVHLCPQIPVSLKHLSCFFPWEISLQKHTNPDHVILSTPPPPFLPASVICTTRRYTVKFKMINEAKTETKINVLKFIYSNINMLLKCKYGVDIQYRPTLWLDIINKL